MHGLREVPAVLAEYRDEYTRRPAASCWVYEVWDTRHRLAYVGIADNFERRWAQHLKASWWLGEINVWYVDLQGYRSRYEAACIEASVINTQSPVYNTRLESASYRAYEHLYDNEDDEMIGRPVKKRRFIGVTDGAQ